MIHVENTGMDLFKDTGVQEFVTLGEKEKNKYNNKFILEMPFPKMPRQLQEK